MAPTQNQQPSGSLTILLSHGSVSATPVTVSLTSDIGPEACRTVSGPRSTAMVACCLRVSTLRVMTETRRGTVPYVPEKIDITQAEEEIREALSEAAQATDEPCLWSAWEDFCSSVDADPLRAPLEIFQAFLVGARTLDGSLYRVGTLKIALRVIRRRYKAAGLTPAFLEAGNATVWADTWAARRRSDTRPIEKAVPMTWEHAQMLLTQGPEQTPYDQRLGLALLLSLDSGWSTTDICSLTWDDIQFEPDGVRVRGTLLPCDHAERVPGLPHDCVAHLFRSLRGDETGKTPVVTIPRHTVADHFHAVAKRLPGLLCSEMKSSRRTQSYALTVVPTLSETEREVLRRALSLWGSHTRGLTWLRNRAWVAMTFGCGLRMASDLSRLRRHSVTPCRAEEGWILRLGQAKNDPTGGRGDVRTFTKRRSPVIYGCVTEYLLVRDLLVPDEEEPLILAPADRSPRPTFAPGVTTSTYLKRAAPEALSSLAALAGLDGEGYSPHSLRRGFAQQMAVDGKDESFIQEALRHRDPDTAMGYLSTSDGTSPSGSVLLGRTA